MSFRFYVGGSKHLTEKEQNIVVFRMFMSLMTMYNGNINGCVLNQLYMTQPHLTMHILPRNHCSTTMILVQQQLRICTVYRLKHHLCLYVQKIHTISECVLVQILHLASPWVSVKGGLWTVDWIMDWTVDQTMDWVATHFIQSHPIHSVATTGYWLVISLANWHTTSDMALRYQTI